MITPSFGLTATERVLPELALDFTTASLDSRVTFTRSGSTATRTNSSGYIESMAANTPRFDYDPVTLTCKGLLIEEARTNVLTYSTDISNAAWTKAGNASVAASTEVSPSGTADAYKLIGGDGGTAYLYRAVGYVTTATAHTVSVYIKKGTVNTVNLLFVTAGSTQGAKCAFNSLGSVGTITNYGSVSGTTATITSVGNGWYRCTMTLTTTADTYYVQVITVGAVFTNLYGFQLEAGAFATSYIPTTTTALTRNADVATMTGTNFSSWYNASAGTLSAEFDLIGFAAASYYTIITLTNNTGANYLSFLKDGVTNNIKLNSNAGGSNIAAIEFSPPVVNTVYQAVTTIKADDIAAAVSASTVQTDTNTGGVLPTIDRLHLGLLTTGIPNYMNGHLRKVEYWKQRVINAEVQAFSKV